jgi:hypothetical protein
MHFEKFFYGFILVLWSVSGWSQSTGTLTGKVTDPTGASIPGATVQLTSESKKAFSATSDSEGRYKVLSLPPGMYQVNASATGFENRNSTAIKILPGQPAILDISLSIEMSHTNVTVIEEPTAIETDPSNNASAIVLQGSTLEALSDDPDELQDDLMALAGVAAGPNSAQIYVDGFSGGQPPPKSAIREIRINQNPFSAQYDSPGHGRIEIFTKPGANHWHGRVQVTGNTEAFNARNPFLETQPPGYHSLNYNVEVGGALSKKASYSFDMYRRDIEDLSVIATPGAPESGIDPVNLAVRHPRTRMDIDNILDYQLNQTNTLSIHYEYWHDDEENSGLGQFSLPSLAYDNLRSRHTIRIKDSQTIGAFFANEIRFRYRRGLGSQNALSTAPTLNVEGYFNGGGNSRGNGNSTSDEYEFHNYSTLTRGNHQIGFGVRVRESVNSDFDTSGFNGTFIFNSAADYNAGNPYQFTQTVLLPGATPETDISLFDIGLFVQDDWKIRPNLTLSGGLRFESQTGIGDRANWAPRVGISWGLGQRDAAKTVLRAGWGIFYDRFTDDRLMNAQRLNGRRQQSYVLYGTAATPLSFYPNLPTQEQLDNAQSSVPTRYQIAPGLRAPYMLQTSVGIEQQITKKANVSVTYLNTRGQRQFFTNNINAPLPGTYNYLDPVSLSGADRPNGINENIFEYESGGIFRQNQLLINGHVRWGQRLSLFGNYALNSAHSDAVGPNSFPSNPYNVQSDYGRAAFDSRHELFFGGSLGLPRGFQLFPFLVFDSGTPYNIVLGQDLNGSTVLNQRPAFASADSDPANVVTTQFGSFDTVPGPGAQLIPYNYLDGPGTVNLNMRVSKTFGFGGVSEESEENKPSRRPDRPGRTRASDQRYQLTFSVTARNVLNYVNEGQPAAILNPPRRDFSNPDVILPASVSPLFGISNSLAHNSTANRMVYLTAGFSF